MAIMIATVAAYAGVGDDITSRFLQNADFSADAVMDNGICTYSKDMNNNSTVYYGMQPVQNWTASNPTDNVFDTRNGEPTLDQRASGVFAIGKNYLSDITNNDEDQSIALFLGGSGFFPPAAGSASEDGQVLGMVAVWGAKLQYTQQVTLPAGAYTIEIPIYNGGGEGTASANFFGFIADDGTEYLAENKTWTVGAWETTTLNFIVEEETTGVISLGYTGPDGSGSMPHLYVDYVKILEGDYAAIMKEKVDALKADLLPLLETGDELGVDTSNGWAVYNDDNATLEQVQAAIDRQKELNEKGMTDFTDYFINNAHFVYGTPLDNGVCTYSKDMEKNNTVYYGMQPVQDWTASHPTDNIFNTRSGDPNLDQRASGVFAVGSDESIWLGGPGFTVPATKANGSTEGNVFGFICVWTAQANYTQNVTLPAGSYTITIPTYNGGGTTAIEKNLCGFIADNGTEYLAESLTFPVGVWKNETIKFSLDEETTGQISIGYKAVNQGSGSMPHLFIDEFTLMFNGLTDIDPSLLALQSAVRSGENYLYSNDHYNADLRDELETAISSARDLVDANSNDVEANTAATTAINTKLAEVKSSIAAYSNLYEFISKVNADLVTYEDQEIITDGTADLQGLADYRDEVRDHYSDEDIDNEGIQAYIDGYQNMLRALLTEAMSYATIEKPLNITAFATNMDYANNNGNGWTVTTGNLGGHTSLQVAYHVAEIWRNTFSCLQTLDNMPAGKYILKAKAFYRTSSNEVSYSEYTEGTDQILTYLVVAEGKAPVVNQAAGAISSTEKPFNDYGETSEGSGIWVPNGKESAEIAFNLDETYACEVSGYQAREGALTFGIRNDEMEDANAWSIWSQFQLYYAGKSISDLYAAMKALQTEASELSDDAQRVEDADKALSDAIYAADDCDEDDEEAILAAMDKLQAAMDFVNEVSALLTDLNKTYVLYTDYLMSDVESEEPTFPALLEEIASALEEGFESKEQIEQYLEQLASGYTTYVQYPTLETASEETPENITPAVLNANFEGIVGSAANAYWNISRDGGTEGANFSAYEMFNNNSFEVSQTIKGLADGYYRIRLQGYYRPGTNEANVDSLAENPEYGQNAVLFAGNKMWTPLCNDLSGAGTEPTGANGEKELSLSEDNKVYVPNSMESAAAYFAKDIYWNQLDVKVENGTLTFGVRKDVHIAEDWTIWNVFELYYLGTTAPTAVEGIAADGQLSNAIAGTLIYSIDGTRLARMHKGVNIIRMADGTVRKVLVK